MCLRFSVEKFEKCTSLLPFFNKTTRFYIIETRIGVQLNFCCDLKFKNYNIVACQLCFIFFFRDRYYYYSPFIVIKTLDTKTYVISQLLSQNTVLLSYTCCYSCYLAVCIHLCRICRPVCFRLKNELLSSPGDRQIRYAENATIIKRSQIINSILLICCRFKHASSDQEFKGFVLGLQLYVTPKLFC